MTVLVEAEVVVPPRGDTGMPLEGVRAEIEVHQLAVLLDAPRRTVVHERGERGHLAGDLVGRQAPQVAGVDAVAAGAVADHGDRLDHLPPRHRPEPRVGRQQVDQVGGPRAGEPDHDDGRFELDVERLGVPGQVLLEPQPGLQQTDQPVPDDVPAEPGEPTVRLDRGDLGRQPVEQGGIAELVEAGGAVRVGDDAVDVEVDLHREGEFVGGLLLGRAPGLPQVLDPHLSCHRHPVPPLSVVAGGRTTPNTGTRPSFRTPVPVSFRSRSHSSETAG